MNYYRITSTTRPVVPREVINSLIDYTNMLANGTRYTVWYDGQVHRTRRRTHAISNKHPLTKNQAHRAHPVGSCI